MQLNGKRGKDRRQLFKFACLVNFIFHNSANFYGQALSKHAGFPSLKLQRHLKQHGCLIKKSNYATQKTWPPKSSTAKEATGEQRLRIGK
jgi:hypothetical protein